MKGLVLVFFVVTCFFSCGKAKTRSAETNSAVRKAPSVPMFSADSAYSYIQQQLDFGPRVPNSSGHVACGDYLVAKLRSLGADIVEQRAQLKAFDGTILDSRNIIASFQPEKKNRILLFAHWDTRPWADNEAVVADRAQAILGANDGASGVGVLLEIARHLSVSPTNVGIDIIFFDSEDYGAPADYSGAPVDDAWCLGSQYWARNPHKANYHAKYGVLLDMVGAPRATFRKEYFSMQYAAPIVEKVWAYAKSLGFEHFFVNQSGGAITDDHVYVNKIAGIPSIDIIQYDPHTDTGFGDYWHTLNDNMQSIDKNTLQAVGTTVLYLIYNEE